VGEENLKGRERLLVLDLNGFLVDRRQDEVQYPNLESSRVNRWVMWFRPHARDFLQWTLANFTVGVWSTAQNHNVLPMVQLLFGADFQRHVAFVYHQRHCTEDRRLGGGRDVKPVFYKELKRIWDDPALCGRFHARNTLLMDDSPYKARLNPPHTLLAVTSWEARDSGVGEEKEVERQRMLDSALGETGEVRKYLETLAASELSVPEFVQRFPLDCAGATTVPSDTLPPTVEQRQDRKRVRCS